MTTKLKWQRHEGKRVTWKTRPTAKTRYRIVRVIPKRDIYGDLTWYHVYVNGAMLDSENRLADAKRAAQLDFEYRQQHGSA